MSEHIIALRRQVQERKALLARLDVEAGDKPMTAEQQTQWDVADQELAALDLRLAQAERASTVRPSSVVPAATVVVSAPNAENQPWGETPRRAFANFLAAVQRAEPRVNGHVDPRLHRMTAAAGSNEAVGSEGGFLVDTQVAPELMRVVFESSQLASRCNRIPIGAGFNGIKVKMSDETSRASGSRWGGVQVYWKAGGDAPTAKKPAFKEVALDLQKVIGLWYTTDELLEDVTALADIGLQAFGEEIAFAVDDAIFRGTGAGQPKGITASGALVSVAAESGQEADTVYYENVCKMLSRLTPGSYSRAAWLINADVLPQLLTMTLGGAVGGTPVYLPPGAASVQPYGTLFGLPVIINEHSSTVGDVGDIVLADLGYYLLIDKGAITPASSVHVNFIYDETAFRFTYRVNGTPMLSSAITPAQGSLTLSPFVALAARA